MLGEIFDYEKISNWFYNIYYLVVINLLFILSSAPVLCFLLFVGIGQISTFLPLFLVTALCFAPAFTTMLFCISKLMESKETSPWKDYRIGYSNYLKRSLMTGGIQILVLFIMIINITFYKNYFGFLPMIIVFVVLFIATILLTPNLYILIMRYSFGPLQTIKLSIALTLGKPVLTMGNAAALFLMLLLYEILPVSIVLFSGSLYSVVILFMNKRIVKEMIESP